MPYLKNKDADLTDLKDYFLNTDTLHGLEEDTLRAELIAHLKARNSYADPAAECNARIGANETARNTALASAAKSAMEKAEEEKIYASLITQYHNDLNLLETEADKLVGDAVKWAKELETIESELNGVVPPTGESYTLDVGAAKNAAFNVLRTARKPVFGSLEDAITANDYENNRTVSDCLGQLENILGNSPSLRDIFNNKSKIRPIIDTLKNVKNTLKNEAKSEINTDFEKYGKERTEMENKYVAAFQELAEYAAPAADINQSLRNVFEVYGKELLSDQAAFESESIYQNLLAAYVSFEAEKIYHIDISNEINAINADFQVAQDEGNINDMKHATDRMNSLKGRVNSAKRRALPEMKNDLKDWYRYVVMSSELDPSANPDEFKWFMFDSAGAIADNHNVSTYGGGGLGFFHDLLDDAYFESLTGGDYANIGELRKDVVKKHKAASSWLDRFMHPVKNNHIGVDEILLWGIYNSITESDRENIADEITARWNAVTSLGPASSLENIKSAYQSAEALGRELNADAKYWTQRKKRGYEKLDDEVNKAAGFSYRTVDRIWDVVRTVFKGHSKDVPELGKESKDAEYDVDKTAIDPKWHPHAQLLLGSAGAAIATYLITSTLWNSLTSGKSLSDELPEILKEFGIAFGVMKLFE